MLHRLKISMLLILLFTISQLYPTDAITIDEIISRIQTKYETLTDISADLEQTVDFSVIDRTTTSYAKLYLKKPNFYKIEYYHPEPQVLVSDGKIVWLFLPENKQAFKSVVDENINIFQPTQFIYEYPKKFDIISITEVTVDSQQLYQIELKPKQDSIATYSVQLWIDTKMLVPQKIVVTDINDNLTTYILSNWIFNSGLNDSLFSFQPHDDIEIIEYPKE